MSQEPVLSVIVTMGFIEQQNKEFPALGDEFDHLAPGCEAQAPWELIVVDRAWPARWTRLEETCGALGGRVLYIPPKPSRIIEAGYRAVNTMRNAGALCSSGQLLAFVDDFCWLEAAAIDAVCERFKHDGRVLCPTFHDDFDKNTPEGGDSDFSGHNPAIYMCTREQFVAMNGFEEHLDGSYGEGDTEWQNRLDRLLLVTHAGMRMRRKGLMFRRTWHVNGEIPQRVRPLWKGGPTDPNALRCNRAFFQAVCGKRIERNEVSGNLPLSDAEREALYHWSCVADCKVCHRNDREQQIASYDHFPADNTIGSRMDRFISSGHAGCFNPWAPTEGKDRV